MKIIRLELQVADLKHALAVTKPLIEKSPKRYVTLRSVLIRHRADGVWLIATDNLSHARVLIDDRKVDGADYAFLLDHAWLAKVVAQAAGGTITIAGEVGSAEPTMLEVELSATKTPGATSSIRLTSHPVAEYSDIAQTWQSSVGSDLLYAMPLSDFRRGAEAVQYAASTLIPVQWCGLVVEPIALEDGQVDYRFAATDRHRMAITTLWGADTRVGGAVASRSYSGLLLRALVPNEVTKALVTHAKSFSAQSARLQMMTACAYYAQKVTHTEAQQVKGIPPTVTTQPAFVVWSCAGGVELRSMYIEPGIPTHLTGVLQHAEMASTVVVNRNRLRAFLATAKRRNRLTLRSLDQAGARGVLAVLYDLADALSPLSAEIPGVLQGKFEDDYDPRLLDDALKTLGSTDVRLSFGRVSGMQLCIDDPNQTDPTKRALHIIMPCGRGASSKLEQFLERLIFVKKKS